MVGLLCSKVLDINRLISKIPAIFLLDKSMPFDIEGKLRHGDGATTTQFVLAGMGNFKSIIFYT
ncbi:hypothetical protein DSM106972_095260 [Dulcicalothrix desertica PCC 7102]|uniref:Uncharacterized protein n=1 Tax=Dulcicalothrix desertica PCC 7102 TaxID=232991 RepID=A0A3S1A5U6_9CYAN|nr:hypothetical protein [Dulcicalothrix desertica]RUS93927.1 hypothetical protein DSM106972_095260 [Dulcicalothrix desertica PCC 7102]